MCHAFPALLEAQVQPPGCKDVVFMTHDCCVLFFLSVMTKFDSGNWVDSLNYLMISLLNWIYVVCMFGGLIYCCGSFV